MAGQVLRMGNNRYPKLALTWTPERGSGKEDDPRILEEEPFEREREKLGLRQSK